jgi:hypothetical protein
MKRGEARVRVIRPGADWTAAEVTNRIRICVVSFVVDLSVPCCFDEARVCRLFRECDCPA